MNITELSVRRPAAITMGLVLLIGLGILGYLNLGADQLPSINIPVITISSSYSGAGAEEIKKNIVKPIESAVAGLSGVDTIQSSAREGSGRITLTFKMETDMNSAFTDVQKAVETVSSKLPKDADKPKLSKIDINASSVLTLSVTGANMTYPELYNMADKVQSNLEKLSGVGGITLQGGYEKELSIQVDKTALEYYGINMNTLLAKLKSDNMTSPIGKIKQDNSSSSVRVMAEFNNIDEIKNLLIPASTGGTVRLSQLANISLRYPIKDQIIKLNGKDTIGINIQKRSDANVVEVVNTVKKELEAMKTTLPAGVNIIIADDTTTFINRSLTKIKENVLEGIVTTSIVLLLFLRSWRSSLIVLVAIPTSLISTFFMMYELKFTLNMMTLMALSLCVGILVDDSIVILENIQRHLGMGKNIITAAIDGRMEIGMAAIAITLCDVVVFAPVAFMSGMTGQFFKQFGLTVVFASLFSLLVSFTITPMLASLILKKESKKKIDSTEIANKKQSQFSKFFDKTSHAYGRFLNWSLNHRWKLLGLFTASLVLSISLLFPFKLIHTEFLPQSDDAKLSIDLRLNPGTNVAVTNEKVNQVEAYLKTLTNEVTDYYTTIGNNSDQSSASIIVKLKDKSQRKKSQSDLANDIRTWGRKNIVGANLNVGQSQMGGGPGGGGGGGKPISIKIKGADMDETFRDIAAKVEEIVQSVPGTTDVTNSADSSTSEIRLNLDRLALAEYGISASDITSLLRAGVQGSSGGTYTENGNDHDIMVQFKDGQVKTTSDLGSMKITGASGQQVFLNQVASIVQGDTPQTISRTDRQDIVTINANIQGRLLGDISTDLKAKLKDLQVPYGYSVEFGGSQQQMNDAFSALIKALIAAIILVYMILVVLYESFLTPAIRMLSLPCALIGAFVILVITGKSLNMMSMIGLIMLDGLASKNGTLLIDYTNTLMKKGMPLREALVEAGTTRLRPILMTSATMIVGMLPAAISTGAGSEMTSGMSWIIIGGMITSTILSPIILPVVYTLMDDLKNHIGKKRKKNLDETEAPSYEA